MTTLKLIYFDFPGGRGEDCRLALHLADQPFEDVRIKFPSWAEHKPGTPFGALPVLEVEGKGRLAQSNAILTYIGRRWDLHPSDPWRAAQHEAIMAAVEDARGKVGDTLQLDADAKKQRREELSTGYLADWGRRIEALLGDGPLLEGNRISVADLKLFVFVQWFASGALDHLPKDQFASCPKLERLTAAVKSHPRVAQWYAR